MQTFKELVEEYNNRYKIGEMWGYEAPPPIFRGTVAELRSSLHFKQGDISNLRVVIYEDTTEED